MGHLCEQFDLFNCCTWVTLFFSFLFFKLACPCTYCTNCPRHTKNKSVETKPTRTSFRRKEKKKKKINCVCVKMFYREMNSGSQIFTCSYEYGGVIIYVARMNNFDIYFFKCLYIYLYKNTNKKKNLGSYQTLSEPLDLPE